MWDMFESHGPILSEFSAGWDILLYGSARSEPHKILFRRWVDDLRQSEKQSRRLK